MFKGSDKGPLGSRPVIKCHSSPLSINFSFYADRPAPVTRSKHCMILFQATPLPNLTAMVYNQLEGLSDTNQEYLDNEISQFCEDRFVSLRR